VIAQLVGVAGCPQAALKLDGKKSYAEENRGRGVNLRKRAEVLKLDGA